MAKIALLLFCIVGVYLELSASTSIECEYGTENWKILKNVYFCYVNNNPSITTRESAAITSISGTHQSGKTNSDVGGFAVYSKTINYFPRGLETFFKNIKAIQIDNCNLKEVHQEDLKPFPKLIELHLTSNKLEVLEEDLFDFNPDLEFIHFWDNKIVHIEPNVFDHLSKLSYLYLLYNSCIDKKAKNSTSEVKNVIQAAKSQCINSEFSSLKTQLESLEKDSKTLNSQKFSEKLAAFEKSFNSSKFANFRPLNYKFEALKNPTINSINSSLTCPKLEDSPDSKDPQNCCQFDQISILDNKLENLTQNLHSLAETYSNMTSELWTVQKVQNGHSDLKVELSSLKSGQVDIKNTQKNLNNDIKTIQNDLKVSMTTQKTSNDNLVPKITDVQNILKSTITEVDTKLTKNLNDIKTSQRTLISEVMSTHEGSVAKISSKIDKILTAQDEAMQSQASCNMTLSDFKDGQNDIKVTQVAIRTALTDLGSKFTTLKDFTLTSQDDMKGSISDIEATLSGIKSAQAEMSATLRKVKTTQNEIKIQLDDLKITKVSNSEEQSLTSHGSQCDAFEERLTEFEGRNSRKLAKIEKDLEVTRSKILLAIDSKVKASEDRLMNKIEELLNEKLGKLIQEKVELVFANNF
ncbi:unnamed protein product [Chironomus riparius]|uniref:Uncharacterized protein n=1 Tax=Chironomus riparius TaxID=315576 RepID=A0A9N9S572_9DIPT|nr:unnamed protein product [Chironomus riparius]